MKVQYVAYDGEVFDTEKECREYEDNQRKLYDLSGIKFYDNNMEFLDSSDKDSSLYAIGRGYYAVIETENDYNKFKNLLQEYRCGDIVEPFFPGVWMYEFKNNESLWDNLTNIHKEIEDILTKLK